MLRYLLYVLFAVLYFSNISAIDFKHIGTYHNAMGDSLCEISGEYEDGSLSVLHISMVADSVDDKATCVIEGKEIKLFCKMLKEFYDSVCRLENRKELILSHTNSALRPMDILSPRCNLTFTKECDGEFTATKGWSSLDCATVVVDDNIYFMLICRKKGGKPGIYNKVKIKDESGKKIIVNSNSAFQMGYIVFRNSNDIEKFIDIVNWDRIKNDRRLKL